MKRFSTTALFFFILSAAAIWYYTYPLTDTVTKNMEVFQEDELEKEGEEKGPNGNGKCSVIQRPERYLKASETAKWPG